MLDANLKNQLKGYLEMVTQPIELVASLDDGAKSQELDELLREIASLSDKISYTRRDDDARKPSFAINRAGTDIRSEERRVGDARRGPAARRRTATAGYVADAA